MVQGLERQLGGIESPMAADLPCPRNPPGGSRPRECLRMHAQTARSLGRGEEAVVGLVLVQQHTQFLTGAWVGA